MATEKSRGRPRHEALRQRQHAPRSVLKSDANQAQLEMPMRSFIAGRERACAALRAAALARCYARKVLQAS